MLLKTLYYIFLLIRIVAVSAGIYRLVFNFIDIRDTFSWPVFWTLLLNLGLTTFFYVLFMGLGQICEQFSKKEYFTAKTRNMMRLTGIYILCYQVVLYIVALRSSDFIITDTDMFNQTVDVIYFYGKLFFENGIFLVIGLLLILFSYSLKKGGELEVKTGELQKETEELKKYEDYSS